LAGDVTADKKTRFLPEAGFFVSRADRKEGVERGCHYALDPDRPPHDPGDAADLNIMGYSKTYAVAECQIGSPKTHHVFQYLYQSGKKSIVC
jgi:hypothetical protein